MAEPTYTVVDLFCGCGGLSRGLERTGRFSSIFGLDINQTALTTFAANHGQARPPAIRLGDIRDLESADLWKVLNPRGVRSPGDLDLLVGGPPCEGFSRNKVYTEKDMAQGERKDPRALAPIKYSETKYWSQAWTGTASPRKVRAYNPFLEDPRNYLFREFLRIAAELRPKIILIENVRQMLEHRDGEVGAEILEWLLQNGYVADARILNAAEYGVPQQRMRAFVVAVSSDIAVPELPWPAKSHSNSANSGLAAFTSLKDAISDLPRPVGRTKVDSVERTDLSTYASPPVSEFQQFVRSAVAGPANHIYRMPSEQVVRRIRAMKPGMRLHDLPKELQTKKYYYNSYGRLEWNKPSNTITKSFLYPGSGRFCHPDEDRVISYREAARLQSFDDDFVFHASSQEGLAHMIGGAVPPLLGHRFGLEFARLLDAQAQVRPVSRALRRRA